MSTARPSLLRRIFDPPTPGDRAPARLFWAAFLIRLAYMTLAHTYRFKLYDGNFSFGFEAGRIAAALVSGHGYADPFANLYVAHTGPTAWLPPLYPLLLAGVFKLFGTYTLASAWVALALNCVFSALIAPAIWELGLRFAGRRNAVWSAWLWVLYPAAMQYAVRWFWEMSLTTALLSWALVLTFRLRESSPANRPPAISPATTRHPERCAAQSKEPEEPHPTTTPDPSSHILPEPSPTLRLWLLFGLLWGLIALSNSAILLALPACVLWIFSAPHPSRAPFRRSPVAQEWVRHLRQAALAAIVFCAVIAPWTLRNFIVFHTFIPLRGNFGAELYMGNPPGADGFLRTYLHPHVDPVQTRLYASLGEVDYVKLRGSQARAAIAADPALFARNTLTRVYFFWSSLPHPTDPKPLNEPFRVLSYGFISLAGLLGLTLAIRRRLPAASLFAALMLLLPLPYYAVTVDARFRHPLEPVLCILGVYLFQSTTRRQRSTHLR